MQFQHVVCGGTFDHLHLGHKQLLSACFESGKEVTIGITSGAMVRHKPYYYSLQSYMLRKRNVLEFAAEQKKEVKIVQIEDIYGPTAKNSTFEALFVTEETLPGAKAINNMRIEVGMKPLFVQLVPFVLDEYGDRITSERIRQGITSREGKRYDKLLISREKRILPESLKQVLREPLGRVISSFSTLSKEEIEEMKHLASVQGRFYLCAIGDVVTYELKKKGVSPFLSVIDGQTKREALNVKILKEILEIERYNAINEKGTIGKDAVTALLRLFDMGHNKAVNQILVQGEEDLLTLAVVLIAPLGCIVWYGQREVGAVSVKVTEEMKRRVYNLLQQFN